ncbi:MAG: hypothetical protein PHV06_08445 [bacterium]|nr:hypothetical protein [bacterium]
MNEIIKKFNAKRIIIIILLCFIFIIISEKAFGRTVSIFRSCKSNLRNLGLMITNYSVDHNGHYPQNLEVLEELGYITSLPTCPSSDKDYNYYVNGWDSSDFTVWCPNPEDHFDKGNLSKDIISLYFTKGKGVQCDYQDVSFKIYFLRLIDMYFANVMVFIALILMFILIELNRKRAKTQKSNAIALQFIGLIILMIILFPLLLDTSTFLFMPGLFYILMANIFLIIFSGIIINIQSKRK